jgi:hypothetical protein
MTDNIRIKAALANLEEGRITVQVGDVFQFDGPVLDYRLLITSSKVLQDLLKWKEPRTDNAVHLPTLLEGLPKAKEQSSEGAVTSR